MAKPAGGKRPNLVPASEEMRRLCGLLAQELLGWPDVSTRPMFGLCAFYRGAVIFALLPDKRAIENAHAIAYKLPDAAHMREGEKWQRYELKSERGIAAALAHLDKAYRKAAGGGPS